MNLTRSFRVAGLTILALAPIAWSADVPVRLTIDAGAPGHAVSPTLHGVFFEDINYGADGGLYAELVQNRSFEHADHLFAWGTVNRGGDGEVTIETAAPLSAGNPHYARLTVRDPGKGFGLANGGYGGMAVKPGENYLVSLRARRPAVAGEDPAGALLAVLEDETGRPLGECRLTGLGPDWARLDGVIPCRGPARHARLVVLATAAGYVDLDVVSLFPEHTFKNRRNGVRADLAQMLADLHPAFMRFPGGCIVEGHDLPNRYQWKNTIGDIAARPQNWNRWQDAMPATAPEYYQTSGLGFFEFFQLCEDLGAEPLPVLNCGMACQYQSKQLVPLDQLDPFVQDALDLIEFANGPADSVWGAQRAAMGHPEPFHLKFLGVGNEQWGEDYFARYRIFQEALKAQHPAVLLVAPAGPGVDDGSWKLAWDHAIFWGSLLPAIRKAPGETVLVADGTSCRQQIADGTGRRAVHVARVLEAPRAVVAEGKRAIERAHLAVRVAGVERQQAVRTADGHGRRGLGQGTVSQHRGSLETVRVAALAGRQMLGTATPARRAGSPDTAASTLPCHDGPSCGPARALRFDRGARSGTDLAVHGEGGEPIPRGWAR